MPFKPRGCCGTNPHFQRALKSVTAVQAFLSMVEQNATVADYKRAFGFDVEDIDRHRKKIQLYRVVSRAANKIGLIVAAAKDGAELTEDNKAEIKRLRKIMWRSSDINEV